MPTWLISAVNVWVCCDALPGNGAGFYPIHQLPELRPRTVGLGRYLKMHIVVAHSDCWCVSLYRCRNEPEPETAVILAAAGTKHSANLQCLAAGDL